MAELLFIIVFHCRHFVRHLGVCNPIFLKLLQLMSGVIPRNLQKTTSLSQTAFLRSTNAAHTQTHADTHTHTDKHDDSIRRNIRRCISPNRTIHTGQNMPDKRYPDKTCRTICTVQNIPYRLQTNYTLDVSVRVRLWVRIRAEWATEESPKHPMATYVQII